MRPTEPAMLFTITTIAKATILVSFKMPGLEDVDRVEKLIRCLIKIAVYMNKEIKDT